MQAFMGQKEVNEIIHKAALSAVHFYNGGEQGKIYPVPLDLAASNITDAAILALATVIDTIRYTRIDP